jgi:hypothetical protein
LTGQATCTVGNLVQLFITQYDLRGSGPLIEDGEELNEDEEFAGTEEEDGDDD